MFFGYQQTMIEMVFKLCECKANKTTILYQLFFKGCTITSQLHRMYRENHY